jgi:hypothetical protein
MRMQFARVFVLFTTLLMLTQAIAEVKGEQEKLSDLSMTIITIQSIQAFITLLFVFATFRN